MLEHAPSSMPQDTLTAEEVAAPTTTDDTHAASGEAEQPKGGGFFAPMRIANFRRLLAGQTISKIGDQFYFVAIPWLVLSSTSSPVALSLVVGSYALALGVFNMVGGVLADRHGPRALMLFSDTARLIFMGALAAVALLISAPPLWSLIALSVLLGIGSGLFYPASAAMTPFLVPANDLQAANSYDQIVMQTSNVVGPGVAGVVLSATRLAFGFVIDTVSFAASVLSLLLIRMPPRKVSTPVLAGEAAEAKTSGSLGEAITFLRHTPFLFALVGLSLLGNFSITGVFEVALPLLLKEQVGVLEGPRAMGIIVGAMGLGSILGAVIAGLAGKIRHKALVAIVILIPTVALVAAMPFVNGVYLLAALFAGLGLFLAISNVLFITVIQRFIPMEMMGRMMSITMFGSFVGTPLSIFVYGLAATVVPGVAWLFLGGAALFGGALIVGLSMKVIWQTVV